MPPNQSPFPFDPLQLRPFPPISLPSGFSFHFLSFWHPFHLYFHPSVNLSTNAPLICIPVPGFNLRLSLSSFSHPLLPPPITPFVWRWGLTENVIWQFLSSDAAWHTDFLQKVEFILLYLGIFQAAYKITMHHLEPWNSFIGRKSSILNILTESIDLQLFFVLVITLLPRQIGQENNWPD